VCVVCDCELYVCIFGGGVHVVAVWLQLFMAMSVLGTVFRGYFFAFHLLNIVNNNQLLKGVIQAVTQNGRCCFFPAIYDVLFTRSLCA